MCWRVYLILMPRIPLGAAPHRAPRGHASGTLEAVNFTPLDDRQRSDNRLIESVLYHASNGAVHKLDDLNQCKNVDFVSIIQYSCLL